MLEDKAAEIIALYSRLVFELLGFLLPILNRTPFSHFV